MKILVFLLLVANLLFYAFSAGYFGYPDNPDADRVGKQVAPERMRIVSRGEAPQRAASLPDSAAVSPSPSDPGGEPVPPAQPEVAPPEPKKQEVQEAQAKNELPEKPEKSARAESSPVCLAWDQLSLNEADQVATWLGAKHASFKLSKKVAGGETNGWWVYIPPLASKADADKKAGELKQFGVTDYFIVQEGTSRHAISLGVFSTEKGAQERLAQLREAGVRSARMMPRPGKDSTISLQAIGPEASKTAVIAAVARIAPKRAAQACQ